MHRPQHPRDSLARPPAAAAAAADAATAVTAAITAATAATATTTATTTAAAPPTHHNDLPDAVCLSQITHLLRLQKYHKRCCASAQDHLQKLHIAAAKAARLRLTARSVQHTLAECIRSEDKSSFAVLLHAFQDAREDASKIPSPAVQDVDSRGPPAAASSSSSPSPSPSSTHHPATSFLDELAAPARLTVLDVLTKLRYDGHFIAERVLSLTSRELNALLPERIMTKSSESIFAAPSRNSRTSRPLGFTVDTVVDVLTGHSYGSPLEALVYAPSACLLTDDSERRRTTDVWATVCARLISEQKSGSEKLIPALLDIWSTLLPWPGKDRIEIWMLDTLQRGAFLLLDQPTKQTFRARVESRSGVSLRDEAQVEAFYAGATESLLELFGDRTAPSAIPPGALSLCHAIYDKLRTSTPYQRALPSFILTRWLFSSFTSHLVNLPEVTTLFPCFVIS